jgi:protein-disulfide isomerase
MNKDVLRMLSIAAIGVALTAVAAYVYVQQRDAEKLAEAAAIAREEAQRFERPHSRSLGPDDARVTLTEFFDPECESCRAVHPMVKTLLERYPKSLRLVLRYMPLHKNSVYAASALEAAGEQGMYWPMLETLYHYQPVWGSHHQPRPDLIPGYAKELGLDMQAFDASVGKEVYRQRIAMDHEDGKALGVRGTPTFFVNGRPLLRLDYSELVALIEGELGR